MLVALDRCLAQRRVAQLVACACVSRPGGAESERRVAELVAGRGSREGVISGEEISGE